MMLLDIDVRDMTRRFMRWQRREWRGINDIATIMQETTHENSLSVSLSKVSS